MWDIEIRMIWSTSEPGGPPDVHDDISRLLPTGPPEALLENHKGAFISSGYIIGINSGGCRFSCAPRGTLVPESSRLVGTGHFSDLPTHESRNGKTAPVRDEYRGFRTVAVMSDRMKRVRRKKTIALRFQPGGPGDSHSHSLWLFPASALKNSGPDSNKTR